jgi:hypothetical protein
MDKIKNLLQQVSIIQKKYDDLAEYSGEHYNVFDILGVRSDELSHSSILTNLLNAKGRHGQKDLFLKLFIEIVKNTFENDESKMQLFDNFDTKKSKAEKEKFAGRVNYETEQGGRIDIIINDEKNNIIIENKVYAGDQPLQLVRYNEYDRNAPILYLTLDGKEACENSKGKLRNGNEYACISYQIEIVSWLEKCIKEMANKPIIRETLNQYLFLIKSLTNQSNNNKMSEEILKIIMKDKDNFDSYITLINAQDKLKAEILKKEFTDTILQNIANKHNLTLIVDNGFYFGVTYKGFLFKNEKLENENLCIRFDYQSSNYRDVLFGLAYIDNTKINDLRSSMLKEKFEKIFGTANKSGNFPCYLIKSKWTNNLADLGSINKLSELMYGDLKNDLQNDLNEIVSKIIELCNE